MLVNVIIYFLFLKFIGGGESGVNSRNEKQTDCQFKKES